MKKITFLLTFLISSACLAQVVLEDFEGTAPTLGFSNGPGSATIVADPAPNGTNGNVLEIVTAAGSAPWQQAELTFQGDWMDLTTSKIATVDVYSTTAFDMLAKVEQGTGPVSATDASHTGSGWETLSFDFSIPKDNTQAANGAYPVIFFFNLWDSAANGWADPNGQSSASTSYVDNITAFSTPAPETCTDGIQNQGETGIDCGGPNCAPCEVPPTVAAPRPPNRPAADVISLFSDVYTDIVIDTFDTPWCPGTTSEILVASNPTKVVTGLGCEGVEFITGRFDATAFTTFHMDIYTNADTANKSFNVKWSNWNGGASEANALEYSATNANVLTSPNPGTWISIDIPLANFTPIGNADRNDFVQFVISSDLGTVYYDNLYLHKGTTASVDDVNAAVFTAYPNPTSNNWTISGTSTINSVAIFDIMGKQISTVEANDTDVVINTTSMVAGMYFAKIESDNGVQTIKLIKE